MKILSQGTAADLIPANATLDDLRRIAASCKACDLWKRGTQTVFGEGNPHAGDKEDLKGHPFVGTAGALLDKALVAAGIDRSKVYVTNVVKHFKWEPRGSRRIHKKRNIREITACRPWLDAEIRLVKPRAIVLLGATAAQALLGSKFRVTQQRGKPIDSGLAELVFATVHPSSILRAPDDESRHLEMQRFTDDLKAVAAALRRRKAA